MYVLALVCAVLFLNVSSAARADCAWSTEEPCPEEPADSRTLNGHAFVPFRYLPWAFASTRVASRTGMGFSKLTSIPVYDVGVVNEDANLVSFSQSFELDVALARFVSVSGGFSVAHAVGINQSGAFNLGINYLFGGEFGLLFRIAHGKIWYLSARGDYAELRAEAVLPVALADSATVSDDDGTVHFNLGSLTQGGSFRRGSAALSLVLAPVQWLGFQATASVERLRTAVESRRSGMEWLVFGLDSSWRLDKVHVPLVVQLGGQVRVRVGDADPVYFPTVNNGGDLVGIIDAGILYSDAHQVDVGLQGGVRLEEDDQRYQFQILLNHVW